MSFLTETSIILLLFRRRSHSAMPFFWLGKTELLSMVAIAKCDPTVSLLYGGPNAEVELERTERQAGDDVALEPGQVRQRRERMHESDLMPPPLWGHLFSLTWFP